ncbi:MAG TPA: UDP-N-acetylmuramate--L-alanine ligase [bacterium]
MVDRSTRLHFVGIGGVGMSAIAHVLLARGFAVSGCDLRASDATRRLESMGARIAIGHDAAHVDEADALVASRAVPDLNVEIVTARLRGIPVHHRAELLAQILADGFGIAIVGTHGKTTTAAMTAHVLASGGCDPTALIGGDVEGLNGNVRLGAGRYVVAEVDESDASLLFVRPSAVVVTSLDITDHRDHYRTIHRLLDTFRTFLGTIDPQGFAVMCTDHRHVRALLASVPVRQVTYGLSHGADYTATVRHQAGRSTQCTFRRGGRPLGPVTLHVPGRYNVRNALAATAVAIEAGLSFADIAGALATFPGVSRRFSVRGEVDGIMVVDDYAHNPIKIAAVLRAAREAWPDRRVVAVFQPHRYTRTKTTYRRYAQAFGDADELIITEIYPADEAPIPGVSARLIVDAVSSQRPVTYVPDKDTILGELTPRLRAGDIVLTLGAGDIGELADGLVGRLRAAAAQPLPAPLLPGS